MDLSPQQLQKYETGKDRLTAGKIYDVSIALKVPIDALFGEAISKRKKGRSKADRLRDVCRMWIDRAHSREKLEQMARVLRAIQDC